MAKGNCPESDPSVPPFSANQDGGWITISMGNAFPGGSFDMARFINMIMPQLRIPQSESDRMFDIYSSAKSLGDFIVDNDIETVVYLDRSARDLRTTVDEYMGLEYPDHDKPRTLFLDPELLEGKGGFFKTLTRMKALRSARRNLQDKKSPLLDNTNSNTMVIDGCSHTGEAIRAAKTLLKYVGFDKRNVATAVFNLNPFRNRSRSTDSDIDFVANNSQAMECRPILLGTNYLARGEGTVIAELDIMAETTSGEVVHLAGEISRIRQEGREIIRAVHNAQQ